MTVNIKQLIKPLMSNILVSESRLNGITAICIIGEVPAGREFILEHKLDKIKQLTSDPDYLVRIAAQECFQVIKWKP